jgi:ATP-dependent protease ClpP protease subunit
VSDATDDEAKSILLEKDRLSLERERLELKKLVTEVEKERVELLEAFNRVEEWNKTNGHSVTDRRIVRLADVIDDDSVGTARAELYDLSRLYPGESLILDINSPGGNVHAGLELFGVVRELSTEGHQIITRISGHAASMGGVIAQAGDVRQIRKHSYLHIHEVSYGSIGKGSEIKDAADYCEKLTRDMTKIYAERSNKRRVTSDWIYSKIIRQEWWLNAEEALENGFVDAII